MKTTNTASEKASAAQNSPLVTGALTSGIGALGSAGADAALVIQDINLTSREQTTGDGFVIDDPFTFDLDQNGSDDFPILTETPFQKHAFISSLGKTAIGLGIEGGPDGEVDGAGDTSPSAEFFDQSKNARGNDLGPRPLSVSADLLMSPRSLSRARTSDDPAT